MINIKKITISGFQADVVREKEGTINLVRLFSIPETESESKGTESEKEGDKKAGEGKSEGKDQFILNLADFEFTNGKLRFSDLLPSKKVRNHAKERLNRRYRIQQQEGRSCPI